MVCVESMMKALFGEGEESGGRRVTLTSQVLGMHTLLAVMSQQPLSDTA